MRLIISPAKKMKVDRESLDYAQLPQFIDQTAILAKFLKKQPRDQLQKIWACSDALTQLNVDRLKTMDLKSNLTPAILSYEGIQYQTMAPGVFDLHELAYIEEHLRILSGFYGLLRPLDGVLPYRLEMKAKLGGNQVDSLYAFWNRQLADQLFSETSQVINLASKEYSQAVTKYKPDKSQIITCVFGEWVNGKVKQKATYAKMARGEMVRYMAQNQVDSLDGLKDFDHLGYHFSPKESNESKYVFIKS